jgi:signal transduction histidine kinase
VRAARAITEAMGGVLQYHDTPGGGLTISLTLPRTATRS